MSTTADGLQSRFLNGISQFNDTSSQILVNQFLDQISALEKRTQANNNAVLLRRVRQRKRLAAL